MRTGPIIGLHHQPYSKRNEHRHEKGEQKRPHRDGNFDHANLTRSQQLESFRFQSLLKMRGRESGLAF